MRSFLLTAAMAATLLTSSLAIANAAGYGANLNEWGHSMTSETLPHEGFFSQARPRLDAIYEQLGEVTHRVAVNRRHGYLSAAEAMAIRDDARVVRMGAADAAAHNGGNIPDSTYNILLGRVAALNQAIDEYGGRA